MALLPVHAQAHTNATAHVLVPPAQCIPLAQRSTHQCSDLCPIHATPRTDAPHAHAHATPAIAPGARTRPHDTAETATAEPIEAETGMKAEGARKQTPGLMHA